MSLYYEAEAALDNTEKAGGSLKSRIFGNKVAKHAPIQIFALISEATKWSPVLKVVAEKTELLKLEKKLDPTLAILLVHDLLLSKRGVAAPQNHPLNLAVSRHKARLQAEFTKLRIQQGFATVEDFRKSVESQSQSSVSGRYPHPRWVRINTVKTTFEAQMSSTFADYEQVGNLETVLNAPSTDKVYYVDAHIGNLIAVPPLQDLSKSDAYRSGQLIFQDKASCIPAVLLNPDQLQDGDVIDACAAPGNKTTHLAALLAGRSTGRKVFAVERDTARSKIMQRMVTQAGADELITILDSTDFLQIKPNDESYSHVTSILLDPSCSGSGIVGRDDQPIMELPVMPIVSAKPQSKQNSKKRKRPESKIVTIQPVEEQADENENIPDQSQRLEALSNFQLKIVQHAMLFPSARRIVYSTCSIHSEENEGVVMRALSSSVAVKQGWSMLLRKDQPVGLQAWNVRGDENACKDLIATLPPNCISDTPEAITDACIRCEKGTEQGTMGFFAAGFSRHEQGQLESNKIESDDDEAWEGFSDSN